MKPPTLSSVYAINQLRLETDYTLHKEQYDYDVNLQNAMMKQESIVATQSARATKETKKAIGDPAKEGQKKMKAFQTYATKKLIAGGPRAEHFTKVNPGFAKAAASPGNPNPGGSGMSTAQKAKAKSKMYGAMRQKWTPEKAIENWGAGTSFENNKWGGFKERASKRAAERVLAEKDKYKLKPSKQPTGPIAKEPVSKKR